MTPFQDFLLLLLHQPQQPDPESEDYLGRMDTNWNQLSESQQSLAGKVSQALMDEAVEALRQKATPTDKFLF